MPDHLKQAYRSDRHVIAGLILLGIAARLVMLALVEPIADLRAGDAEYYLQVAQSLLATGSHAIDGVPTAYRPPAYPVFLAAILAVGVAPVAVLAVQSCLSIGAALVTFALLKADSRPLAVGVAAIIVSSPFLIVYDYKLIAEALYISLVWVAWLLQFTAPRIGGAARAILAGLLIGIAILTRDTLLLLPLFALPFALFSSDRKAMLKRLLLAAAASYLTITPWMLRNASLPNEAMASEGRFGLNLWVGTWERNGDWALPGLNNADFPSYAFRDAVEERNLRQALQRGDDAPFRQAALARLRTEPGTVLVTWLNRYPQMWLGTRTDQIKLRHERGSPMWTVLKAGFYALNLLFVALGVAGLMAAVRQRSRWSFFVIPILYTAGIYLPFHNSETRYSLMAMPFLFLFGLWFALRLFSTFSQRRQSS